MANELPSLHDRRESASLSQPLFVHTRITPNPGFPVNFKVACGCFCKRRMTRLTPTYVMSIGLDICWGNTRVATERSGLTCFGSDSQPTPSPDTRMTRFRPAVPPLTVVLFKS